MKINVGLLEIDELRHHFADLHESWHIYMFFFAEKDFMLLILLILL